MVRVRVTAWASLGFGYWLEFGLGLELGFGLELLSPVGYIHISMCVCVILPYCHLYSIDIVYFLISMISVMGSL